MSDQRILVIENPANLRIDLGRLKIERKYQEPVFVLPEDIAVLCLEHHTVTVTVSVLRTLADAGTAVLVMDARHLPCAVQLPLTISTLDAGRLRQQIALDASEKRGELWRQLVAAKLRSQAYALRYLQLKGALRLDRLAAQTQPGDAGNAEGQGAKHYWRHLFPNNFQRSKQGAEDALNIRLNYGYAVLRAMISRSLVASGLNSSLGLGHCNAGNAFNLADDFIEPYRFLVDVHVAKTIAECDEAAQLGGLEKKRLLSFTVQAVRMGKQDMRLTAAISASIASFIRILDGKNEKLMLPEGLAENPVWVSTAGE